MMMDAFNIFKIIIFFQLLLSRHMFDNVFNCLSESQTANTFHKMAIHSLCQIAFTFHNHCHALTSD